MELTGLEIDIIKVSLKLSGILLRTVNMYLHVLSLTVLSTSITSIYMLDYRMGTPGYFGKEMGMYLVFENGSQ